MYENILHKPLRLRTNISASARNILEGVSLLCSMSQIKEDFQSVLCTLESLFMFFFVLFCFVQNVNITQLLHEVNSKFHVNRHYGYEAYASFFLVSIDETELRSCKNQ